MLQPSSLSSPFCEGRSQRCSSYGQAPANHHHLLLLVCRLSTARSCFSDGSGKAKQTSGPCLRRQRTSTPARYFFTVLVLPCCP